MTALTIITLFIMGFSLLAQKNVIAQNKEWQIVNKRPLTRWNVKLHSIMFWLKLGGFLSLVTLIIAWGIVGFNYLLN